MPSYVLNGTPGVNPFAIDQRVWSGSTVVGYNDYVVNDFTLGQDSIRVQYHDSTVSFSTVAQFKQAMLDIEATGLKGHSALGTDYAIVGNDVVFSFDGQGSLRLNGLASALDLGPSNLVGVNGTDRADTITVSYTNPGVSNVLNSGYGDDKVHGGAWADSISNQGGSDTVWLGSGDDFFFGADDAAQVDTVYGDAGNDTIFTYKGDDVIFGGAGNDAVTAGLGNDTIDLGAGADVLNGFQGHDVVTGGTGRDYYKLGSQTVDKNGTLRITDLRLGGWAGDSIGEDQLDFTLGGVKKSFTTLSALKTYDASTTAITVSQVGDDLVIDSTVFGRVIADDFYL